VDRQQEERAKGGDRAAREADAGGRQRDLAGEARVRPGEEGREGGDRRGARLGGRGGQCAGPQRRVPPERVGQEARWRGHERRQGVEAIHVKAEEQALGRDRYMFTWLNKLIFLFLGGADRPERSYLLGLQLTPPRTSGAAFEVRGCQRWRRERRLTPLQLTTDQGWTEPPGTPAGNATRYAALGSLD
ncbi:hypothetical protein THAOC_32672, partial [Thalassiosira oceanica]